MIKGLTPDEHQAVWSILKAYPYRFFYYGSRVTGGFSRASDLDLLVKGPKTLDLSVLEDIRQRFDCSALPMVVNLVDYHQLSERFYRNIADDLVAVVPDLDEVFPMYDPNNIFARILRGEIPCKKIYEDDFALAFPDINPQAPVHVLVIPKGEYVSMEDFTARASDAEIAGFFRAVRIVAEQVGVTKDGWRMLANVGANGGQEVPHLHIHIFGGKALGPMLNRG